jgi:hypothetical protein
MGVGRDGPGVSVWTQCRHLRIILAVLYKYKEQSMLKFDHFQGSPIIEGLEEYKDTVPIMNDGYNDGSKTYLNAYSDLLANEKMLSQISTGLIEKIDAQKYCNAIKKIKKDGIDKNDVTYHIQNNYLTDNKMVSINSDNKESYLNGKCVEIGKWATNKDNLIPIDINAIGSVSQPEQIKAIYSNFGQSIVSDLSYIGLLINKSNTIIKGLVNKYPKMENNVFQTSVDQYNANVALRGNLDSKMIELYSGDQSIAMYQKKSADSVVYANVLWTILATSLIYFVFIKI